MNDIQIRPLEWHWSEWVERYQRVTQERLTQLKKLLPKNTLGLDQQRMLANITLKWGRDDEAWVYTLTDNQRLDVVDLLCAECEALWALADPAAHHPSNYFPGPPTADDRLDFRERWYTAIPLLTLAEQFNFLSVVKARHYYNDLEKFVTERHTDWLP